MSGDENPEEVRLNVAKRSSPKVS